VINYQFVQDWLLKTVWGVLVLGAIGSIIGAIVIFVLKKITKKVVESKDGIIMRLIYPMGREIEIGEKIRNALGPTGRDGQFLIYHTYQSLGFIFDIFALILSVTLTAHVAIAYGLERPILLSVIIALNLILFRAFLKSGIRLCSHVSEAIELAADEIEKSQPKKFSDWDQALSKKNPS
jgi:hypothetical protein